MKTVREKTEIFSLDPSVLVSDRVPPSEFVKGKKGGKFPHGVGLLNINLGISPLERPPGA